MSWSSDPAIRRTVLASVLSALLCAPAMGQTDRPVSVAAAGLARLTVRPGDVVTIAVNITNTLDQQPRCVGLAWLPPGWKTIAGNEDLHLHPDTTEMRFFSFVVPRGTIAGNYTGTFEVRAADRGGLLSSTQFWFEVTTEYDLRIALLDAPRYNVAGSSSQATFLVQNKSNVEGSFAIRTRLVPETPVRIEPDAVTLLPGEERVVRASFTTQPDVRVPYRQLVELRAMLVSDTTVHARNTALISVAPRTTIDGSGFSIPLQLTLRSTGENGETSSQAELYGAGSFAGSETDRYELLLRGPDNRTQSLLGLRDEYRAAYQTGNLDAVVGDQPFRLTQLTEYGRYGVGARADYRFERLMVGGFMNQTRWSPSRAKEFAGFATYGLAPHSAVGINYLQKREGLVSDILTVQGGTRLFGSADISLEAGGSRSSAEEGKAVALQVRSLPQVLQYGFNLIHADPGYRGYYRDYDAISLNAQVYPTDELRIEGLARDEKRNLDLNPVQLHAPHYQHLQLGTGYGQYVAAYYKIVRRRDRLQAPKYDHQENSVVMRFSTSYTRGSLTATIDLGRTMEHLLGRSYPLRRFGLSARFQPDPSQQYSISLEHRSEKDLFTDRLREGSTWSAAAWYYPATGFSMHVNIYQSWTIAPLRQQNTLAEGGINYTLPWNHTLSGLGRVNLISSGSEVTNSAFSLEYRIPFGLSFSEDEGEGSISGRLYDLETGRGIQDILVYADDRVAVTDNNGKFEFPNLREGTHTVSMDRGVAGPDRIPDIPLPLSVEIRNDQQRFLEIGITRSGSVSGQVRLAPDAATQDENAPGRSPSFAGITIELTREEEVYRRVTGYDGRFELYDLRPGAWKLRVVGGEIPDGLEVENPEKILHVRPGDRLDVPVILAPVQRTIRVLQEGMLLRLESGNQGRPAKNN